MRISKEGYGLKSYRHEVSKVTKMGSVATDPHYDGVNKDLPKHGELYSGCSYNGGDADESILVLHAGVID